MAYKKREKYHYSSLFFHIIPILTRTIYPFLAFFYLGKQKNLHHSYNTQELAPFLFGSYQQAE